MLLKKIMFPFIDYFDDIKNSRKSLNINGYHLCNIVIENHLDRNRLICMLLFNDMVNFSNRMCNNIINICSLYNVFISNL